MGGGGARGGGSGEEKGRGEGEKGEGEGEGEDIKFKKNFICNSQKLETTQHLSTGEWISCGVSI